MKKKKLAMHWQILIALVAGIFFALYFHEYVKYIAWVGDLFLRLLRMIIIPLVFSSIVMGVSGLGASKGVGRISAKTLGYYFLTTLIAILTGLILVNLFKPGVGADLSLAEKMETVPVLNKPLGTLLIEIVPENIFTALSEGNLLPIIFFAIVFGYFMNKTEARFQNSLNNLFSAINEVMMAITMAVIKLTPYGVFAIMASTIGKFAGDTGALLNILSKMGLYMLTVLLALSIQMFLNLSGFLYFLGKINPLEHLKNMSVPIMTAFSTSSSNATLPLSIDAVENKAGVHPSIASFTLPLGATVNMNGTALYECIAVMFISQAYGIELTLVQQAIVVLTALLAAVGSAGIPMAGLVMMAVVLNAVGLPLEGIGLILAVDRILDMFRTVVNVYGDTTAAVIIAKSENLLVK